MSEIIQGASKEALRGMVRASKYLQIGFDRGVSTEKKGDTGTPKDHVSMYDRYSEGVIIKAIAENALNTHTLSNEERLGGSTSYDERTSPTQAQEKLYSNRQRATTASHLDGLDGSGLFMNGDPHYGIIHSLVRRPNVGSKNGAIQEVLIYYPSLDYKGEKLIKGENGGVFLFAQPNKVYLGKASDDLEAVTLEKITIDSHSSPYATISSMDAEKLGIDDTSKLQQYGSMTQTIAKILNGETAGFIYNPSKGLATGQNQDLLPGAWLLAQLGYSATFLDHPDGSIETVPFHDQFDPQTNERRLHKDNRGVLLIGDPENDTYQDLTNQHRDYKVALKN